MIITELRVCEDPKVSGMKRLITTITPTCKFQTAKWWNLITDGSTHTAEVQLKLANEMMYGWKRNGPWPDAEFYIEQMDKYTRELVW